MEKEVIQTWQFQQSPRDVWQYLTQPELIAQWLMTNDFKPVVGHRFQFASKEKVDAYCEVLEVVPQKRLSYRWRKGKGEDEIRVDSVVTWTLSGKNGGTELLLEHRGFTTRDDAEAHSKGWDYCLNRMTEQINSFYASGTF